MNCAVVDVVPKGSHDKSKRGSQSETLEARDTSKVNTAAQSALSSYPPIFVANLAKINDCVTKETQDVTFDAPGKDVAFADGKSRSAAPSFNQGKCTGRGSDGAGSSSSSSSSPPPPSGNNVQWNGGSQGQPSSSQSSPSSPCANVGDGQWHPECYNQPTGQKAITDSSAPAKPVVQKASAPAPKAQTQQTVQDLTTGKQPSPKVEKELDAYLATLYSTPSKRTACAETKREPCASPNRWLKRAACIWTCSRKGRRAELSSSIPTTPQAASLESSLQTLSSTITHLIDLISIKQKSTLSRRDTLQPSNVTSTTTTTTPESNSFDLFLTYLSRLQSTVIECIRTIADATPSGAPAPAIALAAANPAEAMVKRQLVTPTLPDLIGAMKIDTTDPLYAALKALSAALGTVGEIIGSKLSSGDSAPAQSSLISLLNSTIPALNATNALQAVADLAAFNNALAVDGKANTSPSPSTSVSISKPSSTTIKDSLSAILPYLLGGPGPAIPHNGSIFSLPSSGDAIPSPARGSASTLSSISTPSSTPSKNPLNAILPYLLGGPGPVIPHNGSIFSLPSSGDAVPSPAQNSIPASIPLPTPSTIIKSSSAILASILISGHGPALPHPDSDFSLPSSGDAIPNILPSPVPFPSSLLSPPISIPIPIPSLITKPISAILSSPLLTGHGPALPHPGSEFSLPTSKDAVPGPPAQDAVSNLENFPVVVDDLAPGAEQEVKDFFEDLEKESGAEV
jgi:hypothetical protein